MTPPITRYSGSDKTEGLIRWAYRLLLALLVLFFGAVAANVYSIIFEDYSLDWMEVQTKQEPAAPDTTDVPLSYFIRGLGTDHIFGFAERKKSSRRGVRRLGVLPGQYELLGVIIDESPQAIIRNKEDDTSLFLREGETSGGITLKKVRKGAVTVIINGVEVELTI